MTSRMRSDLTRAPAHDHAVIGAEANAIVFRQTFDRLGLLPDCSLVGSESPGRQDRLGGKVRWEGLADFPESVRIFR